MHAVSLDAEQVSEAFEKLRRKTPRVHCITNSVAQNFTANVLLAAGAVPSMTIAPEEVASFVGGADALLINLGTLDTARRLAIEEALAAAEATRRPWVLDPVFINRSPVRAELARELLLRRPTVVKANPPELAELQDDDEGPVGIAPGTAVACTGPEDQVSDNARALRLNNGSPLLSKVTATGCAAGALIGAFLAIESDPVVASASALSVFNIAGEVASQTAAGPGSFVPAFLDALHNIETADIAARLKAYDASVAKERMGA